MPLVRPLEHLNALDVYVPGQSPVAPGLRLASNENPYGCSPRVAEATAAVDPSIYPDGSAVALRQLLSQLHGLDAAQIICGAGSDDILHMLARAYLDSNSAVIVTRHAFSMYALSARQSGARVDVVEETGSLCADVDAMLAAVTERTRMVFIANPNNPTGSWLSGVQIDCLHRGLPGDVMLVIDGAYAEYADEPGYSDGLELARCHENVVAVRTFSKIHGLAALRLGWACASREVIDVLNRVRGPFNVSQSAQVAGIAALGDRDFVVTSARRNRRLRARLSEGLTALGLTVFPSQGNFVLVRFLSQRKAQDARAALLGSRIMVRDTTSYGLPDCLRITIGDEEAVEACLAVFGAELSR